MWVLKILRTQRLLRNRLWGCSATGILTAEARRRRGFCDVGFENFENAEIAAQWVVGLLRNGFINRRENEIYFVKEAQISFVMRIWKNLRTQRLLRNGFRGC